MIEGDKNMGEMFRNFFSDDFFEKAEKQGTDKELDIGVSGAVTILRKMKLDDKSILEEICSQYQLTKAQAKKYL